MAHILITSGPTRQYLDPVRFLTNGSSGRMGLSLVNAALQRGHEVTVVSGPVEVTYPAEARVIPVMTTDEMLEACRGIFPNCDGLIGVAAPCDYRPEKVQTSKISKTGEPILLKLIETPDIVATLGATKTHQWIVGFALETEDARFRAIVKAEKKSCDLMILNGPQAMHATNNQVEVLSKTGDVLATIDGPKEDVAEAIFELIEAQLIRRG